MSLGTMCWSDRAMTILLGCAIGSTVGRDLDGSTHGTACTLQHFLCLFDPAASVCLFGPAALHAPCSIQRMQGVRVPEGGSGVQW